MLTDNKQGILLFLKKNAVLLILLFFGIILMLLSGRKQTEKPENLQTEQEARLCETLMKIEGVGEAHVLLAEKSGRNGGFTGAVIVCSGAQEATVRLRVIGAVSAFTGLGSDRILVQKMTS